MRSLAPLLGSAAGGWRAPLAMRQPTVWLCTLETVTPMAEGRLRPTRPDFMAPSSRTPCDGPGFWVRSAWQLLAMCGCQVLKMWLVQLRNEVFNFIQL